MNIHIAKLSVDSRTPKRVDDRRNKRYCYEFGFSFIYTYEYDEEELDLYDAEKHARRISGMMQRSIGRHSTESKERFRELMGALFTYYKEQFDAGVTALYQSGEVHGSTFTHGKKPCFYVNFGFSLMWPKPSMMPKVEQFELMVTDIRTFLVPHAQKLLDDGLAEFAQEQVVEKAAQDAQQLVEAVRIEASKKAKEACRYEQRLTALQAEYHAEFALQVDKIIDDESEWAEALENGCSPFGVSYVREQRSEIRQKPMLGFLRGPGVRANLVNREHVAAHVESKQEATDG